jgi:hypothetical protein
LFDKSFDILLTFQVKRTSRCSDKALSLNQHWFSPSTPHAGFNGWTLYSIPFTNNDNPLPFQLHVYTLPSFFNCLQR